MAEAGSGSERVRYRFSPLERRGVIAGWRGGQIATVAAGLVLGVFGLRSSPSVAGVLIALVVVAAAVAFAFWPVLGRTGDQWLPLGLRWLWARVASSPRDLGTVTGSPSSRWAHAGATTRATATRASLRARGPARFAVRVECATR